jgi:hypothetical protein
MVAKVKAVGKAIGTPLNKQNYLAEATVDLAISFWRSTVARTG